MQDPPFTKLDLVSCRNLLIYLKPPAQERLLSLFHYALKPGGILFLGSSESITGLNEHFTVTGKKWKIFLRDDTGAHDALPDGFSAPAARDGTSPVNATDVVARTRKQQLSSLLEKALLLRYAPASVIVNDRGDILHIHGRTGDYLEPATGHPRLNLFEMAREGLRLELPSALRRAAKQGEVVHAGVRVKANGGFCSVRLTVAKLAEPELVRGLFLVTFETGTGAGRVRAQNAAAPEKDAGGPRARAGARTGIHEGDIAGHG